MAVSGGKNRRSKRDCFRGWKHTLYYSTTTCHYPAWNSERRLIPYEHGHRCISAHIEISWTINLHGFIYHIPLISGFLDSLRLYVVVDGAEENGCRQCLQRFTVEVVCCFRWCYESYHSGRYVRNWHAKMLNGSNNKSPARLQSYRLCYGSKESLIVISI